MNLIDKYFPGLTTGQRACFEGLDGLYRDWNAKINVISRKDIDELYLHHVLHSLGITRMLRFKAGSRVIDLGTGGGFPGIPLAILFPEVEFLLIDSVGKKVKVCTAVAEALKLGNVRCMQARGEELREYCDFVVSRAAMALPELVKIARSLVMKEQRNALPNGLICLKGGELATETAPFRNRVVTEDLYPAFEEDYFKTKKVLYLPI